jgi:hypothetical protein
MNEKMDINDVLDIHENGILKRIQKLTQKYPLLDTTTDSVEIIKLRNLISELNSDNEALRCNTAVELSKLHNQHVIVPLARAFYAHTRTEEPDLDYLQPYVVRVAIGIALQYLGEDEELIKIISSESPRPRNYTIEALKKLGEWAVDCLIEVLSYQEPKPGGAFWAAAALGKLNDKRAVEPLIILLKDKRADLRTVAVEALGELGDKQALPALQQLLETDSEKDWFGNPISRYVDNAIKQIMSAGT